ncbi:DUF4232 domain-containing protein [Streptomyces sp. NPDC048506]|uniref:DUF4232 domain-containing protein n=1 Tax=Streptomyces sp. NPDC048506 TaxID=3155028 RepID=UPI0034489899
MPITMRTIRVHAVVATAAVFATLSLSACQTSSDAGSPGHAAADATTMGPGNNDGHGKGGTPTARPSAGRNAPGPGASGPGHTSGGQPRSSDACTGENTTAVVSKARRPINHLLLKVTNKGPRTCSAHFAPSLRFDDEQAATQINQDSKPQSVVTLAPGRSAYASIMLSGEGGTDAGGRTARRLTVYFTPRSGSGSVGAPLVLVLPAGTYKDNDAAVTYWQSSATDALQF